MSSGSVFTLVRIGLIVLTIALLLASRRPSLSRFEHWLYSAVGVIGVVAFFNCIVWLRGADFGFVDRHEQFHYQLGSKYFPELGFDGLYAAAIVAQRETAPEIPLPPDVRDLKTYRKLPPQKLEPSFLEVRTRFSDERWAAFRQDHADYLRHIPIGYWPRIYVDHGYNPTPAWTFVARLFTANSSANSATLAFLGSLDAILLALMSAAVFWAFGHRTGCLFLAVIGLGFGWRYMYVGALLRIDWLAGLVIGTCLLKRERFALAGICFAWATMMRVFPVAFLAGPLVVGLRSLSAGRWPRWVLPFGAAFLLTATALGVAGSTTGRGVGAWQEFAGHISLYRGSWTSTQVGLDTLFVSPPSFLATGLQGGERRVRPEITRRLEDLWALRALAAAALLGLAGLAAWGSSLPASVPLGLAVAFALAPAPGYYWIIWCLVPLRSGVVAAIGLLSVELVAHLLGLLLPGDNPPWVYGFVAWMYAAFLAGWMLPAALRRWLPPSWLPLDS